MAKIDRLIKERYRHPDLQAAISAELNELEQKNPGHIAKIEKGELTLPSEHDAARHHSGFAEQERARHWAQVQRSGGPQHSSQKEAEALIKLDELLNVQE
jgi:hypothetical protein